MNVRDEYEFLYELGTGSVIIARIDSSSTHGLNNAIERLNTFRYVRYEMTNLEAPDYTRPIENLMPSCFLT